jgi:hypothetical protein
MRRPALTLLLLSLAVSLPAGAAPKQPTKGVCPAGHVEVEGYCLEEEIIEVSGPPPNPLPERHGVRDIPDTKPGGGRTGRGGGNPPPPARCNPPRVVDSETGECRQRTCFECTNEKSTCEARWGARGYVVECRTHDATSLADDFCSAGILPNAQSTPVEEQTICETRCEQLGLGGRCIDPRRHCVRETFRPFTASTSGSTGCRESSTPEKSAAVSGSQ